MHVIWLSVAYVHRSIFFFLSRYIKYVSMFLFKRKLLVVTYVSVLQSTGVRSIAFHPEGKTLFSGLDNCLKVIPLPIYQ